MSFFIIIGFLVITLWLITKYRIRLADFFYKLPVSQTWAAVIAAFVFSVIEEASINIASGTLPVLIGTVPPLVLFAFVFGKLGQICKATTIRYPLLALILFGIFFEITVGGHSQNFQNPESVGLLVFGLFFTALTYAYTAIVGLTMMIERKKQG